MTLGSSPPRVLHVSQPSDAGVAVVVRHLAADQVARGWSVGVACDPTGDLAAWITDAGATLLPWTADRSPGATTPVETLRLRSVIRTWAPDLVHLHSAKAGLAGRLAMRGRTCTIFQPHAWSFLAVAGPLAIAATRWERFAARWADVIACVSEGEQEIGRGAGIEADWMLTPNGVDLAAFPEAGLGERASARQRLDIDPAIPVVLCVGRVCRQKGQDVLVAAWSRVVAAVPSALLVIIGDGPDLDRIRHAAPAAARFVGKTEALRDWYAAASVVAQPSRWEAGAPLTVLEALATGRAVVVSDVPGVSEAVTEGLGAVVPAEDASALADALVARLRDPQFADAEGAAGARAVAARYALNRTNQRVADVYGAVLEQRRRASRA